MDSGSSEVKALDFWSEGCMWKPKMPLLGPWERPLTLNYSVVSCLWIKATVKWGKNWDWGQKVKNGTRLSWNRRLSREIQTPGHWKDEIFAYSGKQHARLEQILHNALCFYVFLNWFHFYIINTVNSDPQKPEVWAFSLTHSLSYMLRHSLALSHSLSCSLSLVRSCLLSLTHSLSHARSLSLSVSLACLLSHSHTLALSLTLAPTHTHTRTLHMIYHTACY